MDLKITITDEDDFLLDTIRVYQNGSDSDGANNIRRMIEDVYAVEGENGWEEPPPGMMTLEEALELKVGDIVTAPSAGVYEPSPILATKSDDDQRVQLLFQFAEGGSWYNYRHIRSN